MKILLAGKRNFQNYALVLEHLGASVDCFYLEEASSADYDGLLLCGGGDIEPSFYRAKNNGSVNIDIERDRYELALADDFINNGKPVLGICRGFQLLNIYFGGSLIQHIGTFSLHKGETDLVHGVSAETESYLKKLYGEYFFVNSSHHQAIDRLGEGLRITLRSRDDGVAEAFEHESLPVIGVQFHPERMTLGKRRNDTVDGIEIFKYFLKICAEAKK